MHLVGFITKKFVTMQHGNMNVKKYVLIDLPNQINPIIFTLHVPLRCINYEHLLFTISTTNYVALYCNERRGFVAIAFIIVVTRVVVTHRCHYFVVPLGGIALLSQCYPTHRDTTIYKFLTTLNLSSGFSNLSAATSPFV